MTTHAWSNTSPGSAWRSSTIQESLDHYADEELAARATTGSDDHFAALVQRYSAPVYRIAYGVTGDSREAEDVAQETFVKLHRSLPQFQKDRAFRPWLFTIAVNTARSALRKRGSRPEVSSLAPAEAAASINVAEASATRVDMQGALAALPPDYLQVAVLRGVEGLAFAEIGEILCIPEATARTRFHRARALLKRSLAAD